MTVKVRPEADMRSTRTELCVGKFPLYNYGFSALITKPEAKMLHSHLEQAHSNKVTSKYAGTNQAK